MGSLMALWLGGVVVRRRISDREVARSIPGCSAARCNSGQVVHTHVPLFIKQYKLVPASAGGRVHHRSGVGYAGSHSADLAVGGQPAPLQHRSYLWLPLYSGLDVTYCHLRRYIIDVALPFFNETRCRLVNREWSVVCCRRPGNLLHTVQSRRTAA